MILADADNMTCQLVGVGAHPETLWSPSPFAAGPVDLAPALPRTPALEGSAGGPVPAPGRTTAPRRRRGAGRGDHRRAATSPPCTAACARPRRWHEAAARPSRPALADTRTAGFAPRWSSLQAVDASPGAFVTVPSPPASNPPARSTGCTDRRRPVAASRAPLEDPLANPSFDIVE